MTKYHNLKYVIKACIKFPLIVIFSILAILLLFVLKKILKIEVSIVRPDRIGHLSAEPDIFLRQRQLSRVSKYYKRIIVTGNPCNTELVKILNRYVPVITSKFGYFFLRISSRSRLVSNYMKPLGLDSKAYELYKSSTQVVKLNLIEEDRGYQQIKKKFGIDRTSWWVCFHARDNAYLGNQHFSYHNFRDSDISNMEEAMNFVTSLGGYAIRYGSKVNKKISSKNPKIIDYSNSDHQSDFLDLFLCAKAKMFIGNTSGPRDLAKMFSVPYALTNLIGYTHLTPLQQSLFTPKKLKTLNGKILSFKECSDLGLFGLVSGQKFRTSEAYSELGLTPIENSQAEILGIVKDMFQLIENKKTDKNISKLQTDFKIKYFNHSKDIMDSGDLAPSFISSNLELFD